MERKFVRFSFLVQLSDEPTAVIYVAPLCSADARQLTKYSADILASAGFLFHRKEKGDDLVQRSALQLVDFVDEVPEFPSGISINVAEGVTLIGNFI